MKKVCIVTAYNSINCGSYWQAFVLGEILKSIGYEVSYLIRKGNSGSSNTLKALLTRLLKSLLREGLKGTIRQYKQYVGFLNCQKVFHLKRDKKYSDIHCFILGSDTIWDLNNRHFCNNRKKYWGGEFNKNRVITYAVSIGDCPKEKIYQHSELFQYVDALDAISVRDDFTKNAISGLTKKELNIVCDPTLLWDKNDYFHFIEGRPKICDFIFLYLFRQLNSDQFIELSEFAKKGGLRIIDGTGGDDRADLSVVNEPQNFVYYMYYADYVVTDTYHGIVFSTNFEKKFVVLDRNKSKVYDFLSRVTLLDRISSRDSGLTPILHKEIQYNKTRDILKKEREKSIHFLKNALTE